MKEFLHCGLLAVLPGVAMGRMHGDGFLLNILLVAFLLFVGRLFFHVVYIPREHNQRIRRWTEVRSLWVASISKPPFAQGGFFDGIFTWSFQPIYYVEAKNEQGQLIRFWLLLGPDTRFITCIESHIPPFKRAIAEV